MSALVAWMEGVMEWLKMGVGLLLMVWLVVALPMLIFRRTRRFGTVVLLYSSLYNAFSCWWFSIIACYRTFGEVWLIVGVLLAGVGVIPLTFFGLLIKSFSDRVFAPRFLEVFGGILLFAIPRGLGLWILHGSDATTPRRHAPRT
jgi:hypothetical protein